MYQKMEKYIIAKLRDNPKTYITLNELEEILEEKIEYIEFVNIIKKLISDGILKAVRKRYERQNSITFFKIQNS